jgi:hypothetical protein
MPITIGNYSFEGPVADPTQLRNNSGVYAVLTRQTASALYSVIDIGEAGWIRDRLTNHDRRDQWLRARMAAGLYFAACYCDERDRMRIERELRSQFNPVCGIR